MLAISVITDLCAPGHLRPVVLADIFAAAAAAAEPRLTALVKAVVGGL